MESPHQHTEAASGGLPWRFLPLPEPLLCADVETAKELGLDALNLSDLVVWSLISRCVRAGRPEQSYNAIAAMAPAYLTRYGVKNAVGKLVALGLLGRHVSPYCGRHAPGPKEKHANLYYVPDPMPGAGRRAPGGGGAGRPAPRERGAGRLVKPVAGAIARGAGRHHHKNGSDQEDHDHGAAREAGMGKTIGHIVEDDLFDLDRLNGLFDRAARLGLCGRSENDWLYFVGAAMHARRVGSRNQAGLFASNINGMHYNRVAERDLDSASRWINRGAVELAKRDADPLRDVYEEDDPDE